MLLIAAFTVSCKPKKAEMAIKDYAKMEIEINLPNPELDKAKVGKVAQKYGYTYKQYKAMYDKVLKDPKLQEQLGEIRLQKQKMETEGEGK